MAWQQTTTTYNTGYVQPMVAPVTTTYMAPTATYVAPTATYVTPTYVAPQTTTTTTYGPYGATTTYSTPAVAPMATYVAPTTTYIAPTTTYMAPAAYVAPTMTTTYITPGY